MTAWGWKPPFKLSWKVSLAFPCSRQQLLGCNWLLGMSMGEMKSFRLYRPSKEQPKSPAPERRPRRVPRASKEQVADSASQRKPRQAPRFCLPFGASAPRARFRAEAVPEAQAIQAHLWNVSEHGSCLTLQGRLSLATPVSGVLEFTEPGGRGARQLPAELRWTNTLGEASFFGLRFLDGPLPSDTYLREFMQQSWTDQIPGSRRSGG